MTRTIIKGVLKGLGSTVLIVRIVHSHLSLVAGVRAIISKGWSDRMSKETDKAVVFPPECFSVSIRCFVSLLGFSHIPQAG